MSPLEATLAQWNDIELWARRKQQRLYLIVRSISQLSLPSVLQEQQDKCLALGGS